ncbi:MAG: ion transporter [Pseudonocardiaceae bacterium]|nr:ion transporter [Pseudonocardiaceae bacterium]
MPLLLSRLLNRLTRRITWGLPAELLLFVFVTSWPLMAWAEPGERIVDPGVYWYWFIVTAATVGYGDYAPTTTEGYLVTVYVVVGGIVTITALFARIAQMIDKAKGLRMHGHGTLKVANHIVILGYTVGRTERIIDELVADEPRDVVICAWDDQAMEHPLAHREGVHFVRGNLTEDAVLGRAVLSEAVAVLVDARDDDEALKVTVAASHNRPDVHTVVALHDLAHARTISRIAATACCVPWHSIEFITEEVQDAGMSDVYNELMHHSDRNTYSIRVPSTLAGRTFGEFQRALGFWNAATILAVRTGAKPDISPSWSDEVQVGTTLYYIAKRRLRTEDLERYVDRAERALMFSERELLRSEWH